jgi:hypothetical protein
MKGLTSGMPLIFQTCAAGFGTVPSEGKREKEKGKRAATSALLLPFAFCLLPFLRGLPRLHRAGPSASLDKSCALQLLAEMIIDLREIVKYFLALEAHMWRGAVLEQGTFPTFATIPKTNGNGAGAYIRL